MKILQILITIIILTSTQAAHAQPASPANWMYPEGNLAATKYNKYKSEVGQVLDSMKVKWMSQEIRGDVIPLIGNIVNNRPIIANSPYFRYAPNEIVAVMGDTLVVLDGAGKVLNKSYISHYHAQNNTKTGNDIIAVSALLDTASSIESPENPSRTLILGFESLEAQRPDSLATTYIGGWNHDEGKFQYLKQLIINMSADTFKLRNSYMPNYSASMKVVYARKYYIPEYASEYALQGEDSASYVVYASVDMDNPIVTDPKRTVPYFRGMTTFHLRNTRTFPSPAAIDNYEYRLHVGPHVSFAQPSISPIQWDTSNYFLLPCMPGHVAGNESVADASFPQVSTSPDSSYLFNFRSNKDGVLVDGFFDGVSVVGAQPLIDEVANTRPRVRSYFLDVEDANSDAESPDYVWGPFILAAVEYNGTAGQSGQSGLYLFNSYGDPLYNFYSTDEEQHRLPFRSKNNHYWAISTGNLDGPATNHGQNGYEMFYPNIKGKEIVATQSSREFAYPGSRLMVFRYNSSPYLTPTPLGTSLRNFDTICTWPIQGWLAAVNDLDGQDGKDEVVIVAGSSIVVVRMRDYHSPEFYSGNYFETVFTHKFGNETITAAAVADVDGDGRNDIIVTTNIGMYVTGTPLEKTIDLISLSPETLPFQADWCFGDTVKVRWQNIIQGNTAVNIAFKENGTDTLMFLAQNFPNASDTAVFNVIVGDSLAGKSGQFIVQSSINTTKNSDTTGTLTFHWPTISTNVGSLDTLSVGAEFTIEGSVSCADSIALYYSFDSTTWEYVASAELLPAAAGYANYTYSITTNIPCMPLFNCLVDKVDTTIYGRIVFSRYESVDSTTVFPIVIKPASFPLTIEPCETMCPTREIRWEILDSNITAGTMDIFMSIDSGATYQQIGSTLLLSKSYFWNVPTNTAGPVILRFCADEYCYKADTVLWNYMPKYIKTVAPNPFKIPNIAEIVYQIDEDVDVTMRIIDQSNRYVKTIIDGERRMGGVAYCERWDGRLDDETPVSNGMYYIMLELSNGIMEIYPLYIRN